MLWGALTLHVLAALAGLAAPRLLGDLVEAVEQGTTVGHVDRIIVLLAGFLVLQTVLTRYARYVSQVLGEQVLAELREDFVANTLALPVGVVESAGSGDLLTRTGRDVDQLGWSVRWALPEWTIALVTAVLTFAAALSVGWWVALPCLLGLPPLVIGLRWYLARAKDGYLREGASYSRINATLTETVDGARTVEALGPGQERIEAIDDDITGVVRRGALHALPAHGLLPEHGAVLPDPHGLDAAARRLPLHPGRRLAGRGHRGDALRADADRPGRPDRLDPRRAPARGGVAGAAARRGRGARRPRRRAAPVPWASELAADDVRFSYVEGRDVLHGVDLDVAPGERVAMVGPSGAGKSTLGRLLAGIHPPRTGSVAVGGVGLVELLAAGPARPRRPGHPGAPRLRRARCARTSRWRRPPGATDDDIREALDAVDALVWVDAAARGPRHGGRLGRPRAHRRRRRSRSRWPGWCSPTRTRWCSTRRPR